LVNWREEILSQGGNEWDEGVEVLGGVFRVEAPEEVAFGC
jgi:hypothetical protein